VRGDGGAEQVVQEDRGIVAEQQPVVEFVQLVVALHPSFPGPHERQEVLQVAVADVGDVEADEPQDNQRDPIARPVFADQQPGLGLEQADAAAAAPQRARHDVGDERSEAEQRNPHERRPEEALRVAQRIAEGQAGDDRRGPHDGGDGHHRCIGPAFHKKSV
jgi:hypothetical protein